MPKIVQFNLPPGGTVVQIADNTSEALDIESTDANAEDYITIDTTEGSENMKFGVGAASDMMRFFANGTIDTSQADGYGIQAKTTASATAAVFIPNKNDPDTGIGRAGTDQLSLIAGGVEGIRLTEAGGVTNVGMGAVPSDYWGNADDLVVSSGGASTGITLDASSTGTLSFATGTSGGTAYQNVIQGTGSGSGDGIRFITAATVKECIRITTAGDILCPQLDASADVQTDGSKNLTTSSDMRLKNPIAELEAGLDKINQLVPRFFSWKNDEDNKSQLGFFSQEVHSICPEAAPKSPKMVTPESGVGEDGVNACDKETAQALDDDGNLDFNWSLNSRAIVALLVKSVQELSAKVTALEAGD